MLGLVQFVLGSVLTVHRYSYPFQCSEHQAEIQLQKQIEEEREMVELRKLQGQAGIGKASAEKVRPPQ